MAVLSLDSCIASEDADGVRRTQSCGSVFVALNGVGGNGIVKSSKMVG